jgi:hypothetical protein
LCALHGTNGILSGVTLFPFPVLELPVFDFAYVVGTVLFFALMLAYVRFCALLGQRNPGDVAPDERAP